MSKISLKNEINLFKSHVSYGKIDVTSFAQKLWNHMSIEVFNGDRKLNYKCDSMSVVKDSLVDLYKSFYRPKHIGGEIKLHDIVSSYNLFYKAYSNIILEIIRNRLTKEFYKHIKFDITPSLNDTLNIIEEIQYTSKDILGGWGDIVTRIIEKTPDAYNNGLDGVLNHMHKVYVLFILCFTNRFSLDAAMTNKYPIIIDAIDGTNHRIAEHLSALLVLRCDILEDIDNIIIPSNESDMVISAIKFAVSQANLECGTITPKNLNGYGYLGGYMEDVRRYMKRATQEVNI